MHFVSRGERYDLLYLWGLLTHHDMFVQLYIFPL